MGKNRSVRIEYDISKHGRGGNRTSSAIYKEPGWFT